MSRMTGETPFSARLQTRETSIAICSTDALRFSNRHTANSFLAWTHRRWMICILPVWINRPSLPTSRPMSRCSSKKSLKSRVTKDGRNCLLCGKERQELRLLRHGRSSLRHLFSPWFLQRELSYSIVCATP